MCNLHFCVGCTGEWHARTFTCYTCVACGAAGYGHTGAAVQSAPPCCREWPTCCLHAQQHLGGCSGGFEAPQQQHTTTSVHRVAAALSRRCTAAAATDLSITTSCCVWAPSAALVQCRSCRAGLCQHRSVAVCGSRRTCIQTPACCFQQAEQLCVWKPCYCILLWACPPFVYRMSFAWPACRAGWHLHNGVLVDDLRVQGALHTWYAHTQQVPGLAWAKDHGHQIQVMHSIKRFHGPGHVFHVRHSHTLAACCFWLV